MHIAEEDGITIVDMDPSYSAFHEAIVDETREKLLAAVDIHEKPRIILDFAETTYFGSVLFEVLFAVWNRVRKRDGRFALCSLQPACLEMIEMAKLDTLWEIYPNSGSAIAAWEDF